VNRLIDSRSSPAPWNARREHITVLGRFRVFLRWWVAFCRGFWGSMANYGWSDGARFQVPEVRGDIGNGYFENEVAFVVLPVQAQLERENAGQADSR